MTAHEFTYETGRAETWPCETCGRPASRWAEAAPMMDVPLCADCTLEPTAPEGWTLEHTGGNCTAWGLTLANGMHWLLTDEDTTAPDRNYVGTVLLALYCSAAASSDDCVLAECAGVADALALVARLHGAAVRAEALDRGRHGWAVLFADGFLSAMPDKATARACAAASDMLPALRTLLDLAERHYPDDKRLDAARAAIAKATGTEGGTK